jgi:drug/metabolite transporter (DMT)-like permease
MVPGGKAAARPSNRSDVPLSATTAAPARRALGALSPYELALYAITVFVWGTSWIALALQVGPVPAEVSAFWRFAVAAVLMAGWAVATRRPMRFALRDHLRFAVLGATLFSTNFLMFYHAAAYLTSGLLAVVFSLASVTNLLLGAAVLGQRIERRVLAGALVGFCGVGLLFLPEIAGEALGTRALIGLGFCLAGTLCFSVGSILSAGAQRRGLPIVQTTAWGIAYGAAFLGLTAAASGQSFAVTPTAAYLGALAWLAVASTVVAFACYLTLLGRIGAARAGYSTVMFPVVALAISTVFEGYAWTLPAIAGLLLTLAGNLLVLGRRR